MISIRSFVFEKDNIKSSVIQYLPMGAKLFVKKIKQNWAKIEWISKDKISRGFVPLNHIVPKENKVLDWVEVAEKLIGTPYKWGGRDTMGIDCSALLQISYETYGINIPRNTTNQINLNKNLIQKTQELGRGSVIFGRVM